MLKAFFKGGSDSHALNVDDTDARAIVFTKCDDEPLPYAYVTEEEAAELSADPSGLFEIEGAPEAPEAEPVKKGRKPKAKD